MLVSLRFYCAAVRRLHLWTDSRELRKLITLRRSDVISSYIIQSSDF